MYPFKSTLVKSLFSIHSLASLTWKNGSYIFHEGCLPSLMLARYLSTFKSFVVLLEMSTEIRITYHHPAASRRSESHFFCIWYSWMLKCWSKAIAQSRGKLHNNKRSVLDMMEMGITGNCIQRNSFYTAYHKRDGKLWCIVAFQVAFLWKPHPCELTSLQI